MSLFNIFPNCVCVKRKLQQSKLFNSIQKSIHPLYSCLNNIWNKCLSTCVVHFEHPYYYTSRMQLCPNKYVLF